MNDPVDPARTALPYLLQDPLSGRWRVIAASRQQRPVVAPGDDGCPFCVGGLEAPDPYDVRVFANRWPSLVAGTADERDDMGRPVARGACEVVLYSPDHDGTLATIGVERVRQVVDTWAQRTTELLQRPEVQYVLVFENRGPEVGATISHPHGQIYGLPMVPAEHTVEVERSAQAGHCVVCSSARDEVALGGRVVARHGDWATWVPAAAGWPFELLVAPLGHVSDLSSLDGALRTGLAAALCDMVARLDAMFGQAAPYLLWIHQGLHVHVHVAPVWRAPGLMRYVASGELGSGMQFNPVAPGDAAERLRAALDGAGR